MTEENAKTPGAAAATPRILDQGKKQFLIASLRGSQAMGAGLRPMSATAIRGVVGQIPGVEVARVLRPRRAISPLSVTADEATEVYVARIDSDRAELIRQTTPPQLIVEEDAALEYGTPAGLPRPAPARLAAWSSAGGMETRLFRFRVVGEGDRPLANVGLSLSGEGFPNEGRTDKRGEATLTLVALPGKRARALFVTAPSNYWDQYLTEPDLSEGEVNVVRLRAIGETILGFPEHFRYGWGQIQMGLDRIPETLTGKGIKVAIVDSGADTSHPLLRHIRFGLDLTSNADPHGWMQDVIGHGSHCAGIVAARDDTGKMLRGFAPEAEVHVLKVFPGGQFSTLIEAIDYCLELEVDVINLSLGSAQWSRIVEQKLEEATLQGIACIVAAGNSGGPVHYPASSPYALAIAAVGRLNEYPDKTWDATTVQPSLVAPDGIFAPSFSCSGPEVAVCAPGVAIVSTVPGGFEPQSGTSMAAPHVTGLAALLLAHHPAFQGPLEARNQQRVAALFTMIRSTCVPYGFGPGRVGAGLPRLHGLERLLQPSRPTAGDRASTAGNGQSGVEIPASPAAAGRPFGQAIGVAPVYAPQASTAVIADPLTAQVWTLQALAESLRRQYGSF
jgi:subtilisin family serine protease